MVLLASSSNVI